MSYISSILFTRVKYLPPLECSEYMNGQENNRMTFNIYAERLQVQPPSFYSLQTVNLYQLLNTTTTL